jgi:hypothetical protein
MRAPPVLAKQNPSHSASGEGPNCGRPAFFTMSVSISAVMIIENAIMGPNNESRRPNFEHCS